MQESTWLGIIRKLNELSICDCDLHPGHVHEHQLCETVLFNCEEWELIKFDTIDTNKHI